MACDYIKNVPFPIAMAKPFFPSQWWRPNMHKAWVQSPALQTTKQEVWSMGKKGEITAVALKYQVKYRIIPLEGHVPGLVYLKNTQQT